MTFNIVVVHSDPLFRIPISKMVQRSVPDNCEVYSYNLECFFLPEEWSLVNHSVQGNTEFDLIFAHFDDIAVTQLLTGKHFIFFSGEGANMNEMTEDYLYYDIYSNLEQEMCFFNDLISYVNGELEGKPDCLKPPV